MCQPHTLPNDHFPPHRYMVLYHLLTLVLLHLINSDLYKQSSASFTLGKSLSPSYISLYLTNKKDKNN